MSWWFEIYFNIMGYAWTYFNCWDEFLSPHQYCLFYSSKYQKWIDPRLFHFVVVIWTKIQTMTGLFCQICFAIFKFFIEKWPKATELPIVFGKMQQLLKEWTFLVHSILDHEFRDKMCTHALKLFIICPLIWMKNRLWVDS